MFCRVQPKGYYYAHLVHTKKWDAQTASGKFWISNLKRHINGYCYMEHIFGKLIQALH